MKKIERWDNFISLLDLKPWKKSEELQIIQLKFYDLSLDMVQQIFSKNTEPWNESPRRGLRF